MISRKPKTTGQEELEMFKSDMLDHREFFASYGFYMPEFDAAVKGIKTVQGYGFLLRDFKKHCPNGRASLKEAALTMLEPILEDMLRKLEVAPTPERVLQKFGYIFNGDKYERAPETFHFLEQETEGYKMAMDGENYAISYVFGCEISRQFSDADFTLHYLQGEDDGGVFFKGEVLINPTALQYGGKIQCAFNKLEWLIRQYSSAILETYISKVESLLSAGKTIAEIRAALFPEIEAIDNNAVYQPTKAPERITWLKDWEALQHLIEQLEGAHLISKGQGEAWAASAFADNTGKPLVDTTGSASPIVWMGKDNLLSYLINHLEGEWLKGNKWAWASHNFIGTDGKPITGLAQKADLAANTKAGKPRNAKMIDRVIAALKKTENAL